MKSRIENERNFWNWFAGKYDKFISKTLGKTYEELFIHIKSDIVKTDELLEIATGTGLISFEICKNVKYITAMDIAQGMIEVAKQKQKELNVSNIKFEVGDSYGLSYKDSFFDKVLASNVLHLLYEPQRMLAEVRRVLKPEGQAILPTFCHGESFKSRTISRFMSIFGFSARNKWSKKSYEEFVESCGFRIEKRICIKGKINLVYLIVTKS